MTTDDQYVPSEDEMRHAYRLTRLLDHHAAVDAAFDRFLTHVRRDAAREALNGLARNLAATSGDTEAEEVRDYRDAHYPEERPVTEQQIDLRERELDYWMTRAYEAEGKLWKAGARIKAVQDLIDQADEMGEWAITCTRLQWAIDGSNPQPSA